MCVWRRCCSPAVVRAYRDREVVLQKEFARVVAQVAQLRERVHVAREAQLMHLVRVCVL